MFRKILLILAYASLLGCSTVPIDRDQPYVDLLNSNKDIRQKLLTGDYTIHVLDYSWENPDRYYTKAREEMERILREKGLPYKIVSRPQGWKLGRFTADQLGALASHYGQRNSPNAYFLILGGSWSSWETERTYTSRREVGYAESGGRRVATYYEPETRTRVNTHTSVQSSIQFADSSGTMLYQRTTKASDWSSVVSAALEGLPNKKKGR